VFGKDGKGRPQLKVFYHEKEMFGEVDNTWWDANRIPVNSTASKNLMKLFDGNLLFDTPKPPELVISLMKLCMAPQSDEIVLDFFSGSATTAHAVMQLNAEDGGHRKFIMVQLPEVCAEDSAAAKAGYATIAEIGKERIRRAGEAIAAEVRGGGGCSSGQLKLGEEPKPVPDVGFRVLKVDSSNYEDVSIAPEAANQSLITGWESNIKTDRSPLDLLFSTFGRLGVPYSARVSELPPERFGGHRVFSVDGGRIVACFDEELDNDTIAALAKERPLNCVVRDGSFASDATAANFEELFRTISPTTATFVL
jgi:adenine-specific DNA-methyltransferase